MVMGLMPIVMGLMRMIGHYLIWIAYSLLALWISVPFFWLFSPLKNMPWMDYFGAGSLLLQAIIVAVLFIRHVYHLGSAPTGGN